MSSPPETRQEIRSERERLATDGDPLNSEERRVVAHDHSLYVNVSAYARSTLDVSAGDTLLVRTFRDHMELEVVDDADAE